MSKTGNTARIETQEPCITDTYVRLQHLMTAEEKAHAVSIVFPKYTNGLATEPDHASLEHTLGM